MSKWYIAVAGESQGPFCQQQILAGINSGTYNNTTVVWRDGFSEWAPISQVPELHSPSSLQMPPAPAGQQAHEINYYELLGNSQQSTTY